MSRSSSVSPAASNSGFRIGEEGRAVLGLDQVVQELVEPVVPSTLRSRSNG